MDKISKLNQERVGFFEPITPYETGFLAVSEIHTIYWEVSGNPQGKPVIVLHGGPGGSSSPQYRRFFDPNVYKIVQFDQRGSGQSTPHACLEENTTWDLVNDIEAIRTMLNIEKWHTVFGGSWGSTLSLVYSETYPEMVGHIILRGIFLIRRSEIQFFYQEGSSWLFPDLHEEFVSLLPEVERGDVLFNFYRRLTGTDEDEKIKFAKAWTKWEMSTSYLFLNEERVEKTQNDAMYCLAFARIESHYFVNGAFLKNENQILEDAVKIKDIPIEIVQGRYDVVCPAKSAWDLKKRLPNCNWNLVPDAGHSCYEPGTIDCLVRATEKFKNDP